MGYPFLFLTSPPSHPCALTLTQDLLSHPTLGLRCTRIPSSAVRVARQGTELSSGLRACVVQAGGSSSQEEEESKVEQLKEKNRKQGKRERLKQLQKQGR